MRVQKLLVAVSMCVFALGLAACGSKKKDKTTGTTASGTTTSGSKNLTIYSSLPLQGSAGGQSKAINQGATIALEQAGGKVGPYKIKFVQLDDSTAAAGAADDAQTGQNARKAVQDKSTIGYLGEYNSGATKISLPTLNKAGIPQISPSNTYVGLTTNKPGSEAGEPDKYYPSGKRTYARVVPTDIIQGAALATVAKEDGCKSIMIWNSKTTYSTGLARNLASAAKTDGLQVEGNQGIDPKAANYRSLAGPIKSDCFVLTGEIESNGVQAVKDVAAAHPQIKLYGGDAVITKEFADPKKGLPADVGKRFKGTIATLDPKTFNAAGKKFFADYEAKYNDKNPDPYAVYGYESMSLLLDSIKRAGDKGSDRQAVVGALLSTKDRDSVLGTYSIDANGDTTLTDYGLYKIVNGGLVFDKVIKAKAS